MPHYGAQKSGISWALTLAHRSRGTEGADERVCNYGETKNTLSPNNYFGGKGGKLGQLRSRHFFFFLSLPPTPPPPASTLWSEAPYRNWWPVMRAHRQALIGRVAGAYLMVIGRSPRAQEVTVQFPQFHPVRKTAGWWRC